MKTEHELSERRAVKRVDMRRVYRYCRTKDDAVDQALGNLARDHPDLGFGKFTICSATGTVGTTSVCTVFTAR
ncbi:MAG: hypothetical protein IPQ00_00335 [Chloracidobacterium sp.]|nr:hypothetical protein [Chloracidobacterium sp.]